MHKFLITAAVGASLAGPAMAQDPSSVARQPERSVPRRTHQPVQSRVSQSGAERERAIREQGRDGMEQYGRRESGLKEGRPVLPRTQRPIQTQPMQSEAGRVGHEQSGSNVDQNNRRGSGLNGGQPALPQAQPPVQSQPAQSQPVQIQPAQIHPAQSQPIQTPSMQSEAGRVGHEQSGSNADQNKRRGSGLNDGQPALPQAQQPVQSQPVQSEGARAVHERGSNGDLNHRRESGLDGGQPVVLQAPQPVQSHSVQSQALQDEAERERAAHEQGIDNVELYRRRESGLDETQPLRR